MRGQWYCAFLAHWRPWSLPISKLERV
uniref:Uncharacterized protein n=1 Tax=Arundo donax TaxID=35708 RepID=A0A0A8ZHW4_ARUDO